MAREKKKRSVVTPVELSYTGQSLTWIIPIVERDDLKCWTLVRAFTFNLSSAEHWAHSFIYCRWESVYLQASRLPTCYRISLPASYANKQGCMCCCFHTADRRVYWRCACMREGEGKRVRVGGLSRIKYIWIPFGFQTYWWVCDSMSSCVHHTYSYCKRNMAWTTCKGSLSDQILDESWMHHGCVHTRLLVTVNIRCERGLRGPTLVVDRGTTDMAHLSVCFFFLALETPAWSGNLSTFQSQYKILIIAVFKVYNQDF